MRSVAPQPWQSTLTRWGDGIFGLALLLTDNRKTAEQLTVAVFASQLLGDPATLEPRLYSALLRKQRWYRLRLQPLLPSGFRKHVLPQPLVQLAPLDRLLLGLWLLRGVDGAAITSFTGLSLPTLARRLASALAKLSPDLKDDAGDWLAFNAWVARQLQPEAHRHDAEVEPQATRDQEIAWQHLVESARVLLRTALGYQHLPISCVDAVAAELHAQGEGPLHWWHHRVVLIGGLLGVVGLVLLLLVAPWQTGVTATRTPQPAAREIVQQALGSWVSEPASGVLHRRVWARPPQRLDDTPLITDVWLAAGSTEHRVEVHHGSTLVEWQIADRRGQFKYAAEPLFSSCRWAVPEALDRHVREYKLTSDQQRQVRDARLTLGAYGVGYQMLQQAATAGDLHSFGTRVKGEIPLLALGFTDTQAPYSRKLILWIAPETKQLHLVQELTGAKGQNASRDLWRIEASEEIMSKVPFSTPDWPRSSRLPAVLLDPACPSLDADHVVSLRTLNSGSFWWGQNFLPAMLPAGTTSAALIAPTPLADRAGTRTNINVVFVGPQRWLSLLFLPHTSTQAFGAANGSEWEVEFDDLSTSVSGTACRARSDGAFCFPYLRFDSRGWSRDEVRGMLATLKLFEMHDWLKYDGVFLEPAPMPRNVKEVLSRTVEAMRPRADGTLHTVIEWSVRTSRSRLEAGDPYRLAPNIVEPEHLRDEQWITYSNAETMRYKALSRLPDGTLYRALMNDGARISEYSLQEGVARIGLGAHNRWFAPEALGRLLLRPFLASTAPITIARLDDTLLLEQTMRQGSEAHVPLVVGPLMPLVGDLPPGLLIRRLWLDNATYLPSRAETVYLGGSGNEIVLSTAVVSELGYLDAPLPDDDYTLPPLPDDTLLIERSSNQTGTINTNAPVDTMTRALVWSTGDGISMVHDEPPSQAPDSGIAANDPRIDRALHIPIDHLEMLDLTKVTTYLVEEENVYLTVRQGPRTLLRHNLRLDLSMPAHHRELQAPSVRVLVVGQYRDAWLINHGTTPVLVVEVDDVLVYVSGGSSDYLQHKLPALLSKLEWINLAG